MKHRILICMLLILAAILMMGAGMENLFYNTEFYMDELGYYDNWEIDEKLSVEVRNDPEKGVVWCIFVPEAGTYNIAQPVFVTGDTNYGIRCKARTLQGDAKVHITLPYYPSAAGEVVCAQDWETVSLYGMTEPDIDGLPIAFVITASEPSEVEIARAEMFQTNDIPSDTTYVWFYDRTAWVAEQEQQGQTESGLQGFSPALLIWAAYAAAVVWVIFRVGKKETAFGKKLHWWIIGGAFALSCVAALLVFGHPTDMTNFSEWAQQLSKVGIGNFYTSGMWADYPPGYLYILYLVGMAGKWFGLAFASPIFNLLVKLPALIADALTSWLIYRESKKHFSERVALCLCALMAFNPMVLFDSAIWGQMDSVLTLLLLLGIQAYLKDRKPLCCALLIFGVLVKPQMLIFGPLFLVAYLYDIVKDSKKGLKDFGLSLLAAVAVVLITVIPFSSGQAYTWLYDKYASAAVLYPYATVNGFNFHALFGLNWAPDSSSVLFGMSSKQFGLLMIGATCLFTGVSFCCDKRRESIVPLSAVQMWSIFLFSHNMHERYLFMAIALLMCAYIVMKQWRYLVCAAWATGVTLVNSMLVMFNENGLLIGFSVPVIITAVLNLLGFAYLLYVWFRFKNEERPYLEYRHKQAEEKPAIDHKFEIKAADRTGEKMVRLDYLIMAGITLVYALIALTNLGSRSVPENYWRPEQADESVLVDFGSNQAISRAYYYGGISNGSIEFYTSEDGENFAFAGRHNLQTVNMYKWQNVTLETQTRYLRITALDAKVMINEMAFLDSSGQIVPIAACTAAGQTDSGHAAALCDEQSMVELSPDYKTEMYFDEIYHARTAFEHLKGFAPYENTHPPLGKVFIMLGIAIFGMNPFGWRIVGTLFGVAMLPMLYLFAKRLFKKTRVAALACFLFAADGMHFVQTRIATIDVYGVFFIICMVYFMYRYWQMNFYQDPLKKTFVPLGLCGVMFGLGAACKWIGFYAGAGLAIVYFASLGVRFIERKRAMARLLVTQDEEEKALCQKVADSFWRNALLSCAFCVLFFVIIPCLIYMASNLPYLLCVEKPYTIGDVLDLQVSMFNYHSLLTATHPFESPWYQWPLIIRPIYYFMGTGLPEDQMQAIAAFGNPAVWWGCLIGTIVVITMLMRKQLYATDDKKTIVFLLIGLGAAYLPWVFISRATFIYHYFASVPYIILLTAYLFGGVLTKRKKWVMIGMIAGAVVLFIWFYPVWSGCVINRSLALKWLQWMPSWWFFS